MEQKQQHGNGKSKYHIKQTIINQFAIQNLKRA
jgi:hypothetical protein